MEHHLVGALLVRLACITPVPCLYQEGFYATSLPCCLHLPAGLCAHRMAAGLQGHRCWCSLATWSTAATTAWAWWICFKTCR